MSLLYVLTGLLAAGLFIYLVVALLWPERFE
ncbi:MAG: K(+)-transporting ATPase subunit F [Ignavibacteriae bacterium]|nr:K(+)-transporting ATPase subunit F [Ignavibacteriota bacterium]